MDEILSPIADLYRESLAEHGAAPKGVGWKDDVQQRLRFDELSGIIEPGPFTCADFGCGYGAMFDYLASRQDLTKYIGYDICPEMIDRARARVVDPRAQFTCADAVTDPVDFVFVSGTFNVKLDAPRESWDAFVKRTIAALATKARRGLAFNLFTTRVDYTEPQLFYADPAAYLAFCLDEVSPRVTLVHDYPLYEWTMLVRTS